MTWKADPSRNMPYPEIVEYEAHDHPYRIIDARDLAGLPTNGMTDMVGRRLVVPLEREARSVSRHELAHVKWSPPRLPRVRYNRHVLMAVEDARINMGLAAIELPMDLTAAALTNVVSLAADDLARGDVGSFILRGIASLGTSAETPVLVPAGEGEAGMLAGHLQCRVREQLERGRRRQGRPVASFQQVMRIARQLARELGALGLLDNRATAMAIGCCLTYEESDLGGSRRRPRGRLRGGRHAHRGVVEPGRMTVRVAPMEVTCARPHGRRTRDWRPSPEGSVVRWIHRTYIDGNIFRRRVRTGGGTVLVDTSGSMSLDAGGVERIVGCTPFAAEVAIYSGRGSEGELRIVARDGRCADAEHLEPFGGGNIIDLPALEWLLKRRAPRVWISDGGVTGVEDRPSAELRRACERICRRGRIQRVKSVDEAVAVLAGR